jgi:hypothetical protein
MGLIEARSGTGQVPQAVEVNELPRNRTGWGSGGRRFKSSRPDQKLSYDQAVSGFPWGGFFVARRQLCRETCGRLVVRGPRAWNIPRPEFGPRSRTGALSNSRTTCQLHQVPTGVRLFVLLSSRTRDSCIPLESDVGSVCLRPGQGGVRLQDAWKLATFGALVTLSRLQKKAPTPHRGRGSLSSSLSGRSALRGHSLGVVAL